MKKVTRRKFLTATVVAPLVAPIISIPVPNINVPSVLDLCVLAEVLQEEEELTYNWYHCPDLLSAEGHNENYFINDGEFE